jgi:hypothetical protein
VACIIGGTPLKGERGSVIGAVAGCFILTAVASALIFFDVLVNWTMFATGAVILIAVAVDVLIRRLRNLGRADARMIRELAAESKLVLLASTDLAELTGLCDRVLVFQRGRIVAELAGAELTEQSLSLAMNAGHGASRRQDLVGAGPLRALRLGFAFGAGLSRATSSGGPDARSLEPTGLPVPSSTTTLCWRTRRSGARLEVE